MKDDFGKILDQIHNHIYANEGLSNNQAFFEVVKLLFIKSFDERERLGYYFISRDESRDLQMSGKSSTFEKRIVSLFEYTKKGFDEIFRADEKLNLSIESIGFIVGKTEKLNLINKNINGQIFQKYISKNQKSERGQFYTPLPIVTMCIMMLKPKKEDCVLDPACGSGNFLVETIKSETGIKNLLGIEINPEVARVAKLGMVMSGENANKIIIGNSFILQDVIGLNKYDLIFANPPFGNEGKVKSQRILSNFDLGKKYKFKNKYIKTKYFQRAQTPEILFIELIIKALKVGGSAAIVVPQGLLEKPKYGYVRDYIKKYARLLAVIDLPEGAFTPYGTSIKTAVLLVKKQKVANEKTFFGKITKLGYKTNKAGKVIYLSEKRIDEDFSRLIKDFERFNTNKKLECKNNYTKETNKIEDRFDYQFNHPESRILINRLNKPEYVELGKLCKIVQPISKEKLIADKYKYIETKNITAKYFEINNHNVLSSTKLPERASYLTKTGDVLIAMSGNMLGTCEQAVCYVDGRYNNAIASNSLRVLRNFKIDPYYLLYFSKQDDFIRQINLLKTGTTIYAIAEKDLLRVKIKIPSNKEVYRISKLFKDSILLRAKSRKLLKKL